MGLLLRAEHAARILDEGKRWEIRASHTRKRGRIALLVVRQDAWYVVGFATIVRSMALTPTAARHNERLIQAPVVVASYKSPHAWVLECVRKCARQVRVPKRKGCVVWVKL